MEIPNGIQTWVPGTNLEACLELAFREWHKNFPREVKGYWLHLQETKQGFFQPNGMSKDGHMRYSLEVPPKLGNIISRMTHKDWVHDKQIRDAIIHKAPDFDPTEKWSKVYNMKAAKRWKS